MYRGSGERNSTTLEIYILLVKEVRKGDENFLRDFFLLFCLANRKIVNTKAQKGKGGKTFSENQTGYEFLYQEYVSKRKWGKREHKMFFRLLIKRKNSSALYVLLIYV